MTNTTSADWFFAAGMACVVFASLMLFGVWIVNVLAGKYGVEEDDGDGPWDWRVCKQRAMRNVIHKLAYEDLDSDERDDLEWHLHSLIYEYRLLSGT